MSAAVTIARARLQRLALAEIGLGIEQHAGGDDRRRLVDAELLQRRIRRRLHVALFVAAVIGRAVGGKRRLAIPRLGQHREMPDRIHLRALLARIAAHHLVGVEGMTRALDADRRLGVFLERHRERRLRHGVRAHIRQLVGFGIGIGEMRRAALPGGGPERVRHADLVAGRPRWTVLRLSGESCGNESGHGCQGANQMRHGRLL